MLELSVGNTGFGFRVSPNNRTNNRALAFGSRFPILPVGTVPTQFKVTPSLNFEAAESMKVRLAILLCTAATLLVGLLLQSTLLVIAAATFHVLVGLHDVFRIYQIARQIRARRFPNEASRAENLGNWTNGTINMFGLVIVFFAQSRVSEWTYVAGWVMWVGPIICWYASGLILREVGRVPLSMGYGGWAVRRGRNGKILH